MNNFLIGTKKNGCNIDNQNCILTFYNNLSFYEKIKKKDQVIKINYNEISYIKICYGITNGIRNGSCTITLKIHLKENEVIDMPITYLSLMSLKSTNTNDLKIFFELLLNSKIKIDDPKNIINEILNSDNRLYDILENISKK